MHIRNPHKHAIKINLNCKKPKHFYTKTNGRTGLSLEINILLMQHGSDTAISRFGCI